MEHDPVLASARLGPGTRAWPDLAPARQEPRPPGGTILWQDRPPPPSRPSTQVLRRDLDFRTDPVRHT